jgi:hypothetical protein
MFKIKDRYSASFLPITPMAIGICLLPTYPLPIAFLPAAQLPTALLLLRECLILSTGMPFTLNNQP